MKRPLSIVWEEIDRQFTHGFDSHFMNMAAASYWVLEGNKEESLDQLKLAIERGTKFPLSELAFSPEWQRVIDDPAFQEQFLKAHEKFNQQRIIAGLEPIEPEWPL